MQKTNRMRAGVACVVACLGCVAVAAPVVNIGTGLSLSLDSDQSGSLTMFLKNDGDATAEINFYGFALMFVQTSGSGTLPFTSWSGPASNPLLGGTTFYEPIDTPTTLQLTSPVSIDDTDYYDFYQLTGLNDDGLNYPLLASETKNVGTLNFTAGPEAEGDSSWDIYVVSQFYDYPPGYPPSFIATYELVPSEFGNLPGEDGAKLKIGTISVTAVPEPSTISLAGFSLVAAGLIAYRRTRRKAA